MATPESAISIPTTQYAKSGRYHIAYQVFGSGAFDLVIVPGFVSHVEMWWELPAAVRGLRRLASFARVILFDKRGTGMSDRVSEDLLPTPEERMDDVRAVMDAAGSQQAAVLGSSEGGWMCALFAATYPDRVRALVIHAGYPRPIQDDDFPDGWLPRSRIQDDLEEMERAWIEGRIIGGPVPASGDSEALRWYVRMGRRAASPGAAVALAKMDLATDIRPILSTVHVPTLVTVREGDENLPASRYMATKIPGAKFAVFPGDEHGLFLGNQDGLFGEIEEFLTGSRTPEEADRVLSTVLFTDIVDSTRRAAALGDRRWTEILSEHDEIAGQELQRHRGRKVSSIGLGDGLLATFDGPARAIRCAQAIRDRLRSLDLMIRSGIHTGEIEIRGNEISGMAVNIGARVASLATRGEVLVSQTVPTLVAGSGLSFEDRGRYTLKGVPDEWQVFAVVG
jgi:class 3 adenylate cyclase/pimeloyl-ACP methyl ester carboxylesterase